MISYDTWKLLTEALGPTQQVYLGGHARAKRNDNKMRYDPSMATGPSHDFSDEKVSRNVDGWLLKFANQGLSPEQISKKLWQLRKVKMAPNDIRDKLRIVAGQPGVKPTFYVGPIVQEPQPDYDRYNFSPEVKEHIKRYQLQGWGPVDIKKFLKKMGHDVSLHFLTQYVHKLKFGEEV